MTTISWGISRQLPKSQKLAGAEGELKEYTIGTEVFHRGEDFDPRKDAVVRVQANVLRKRLTSYYEEEGVLDPIVIEIPKGHYVPQFHLRPAEAGSTNLAEPASVALLSTGRSLAGLTRWRAMWLIAATFVLGLVTAFAYQHWAGNRNLANKKTSSASQPAVDPIYLPLWGKFFEPGAENLLVYGTPQFFVAKGVYLRDVEINSPQEFGMRSRLISLRRASHLDFKPIEVYTGIGEAHGVYLLTHFFSKAAFDLRVSRSRTTGWNEMKNANVIILSSMRFQTPVKQLPYPSDFVMNSGTSSQILNLRPSAGESTTYGGTGKDEYGVLTVWPGKLQQRRIVILSGSTTWATQAMAEYVTDPEYLRRLNQHLEQCANHAGGTRHSPYFQVLLRAQVQDNQPISISYVTHHDLKIADQVEEMSGSANDQQLALRRQ